MLEFIKKNPGITRKEINGYFQSQVSTSLYKLVLEGKLTKIKEGSFRWYVKERR